MILKKSIYILLSILLGIIFSFIMHAAIEIVHLNTSDNITWYSYVGKGTCALSPVFFYGLPVLFAIGGYFLGQYWWKLVYIEKRHWRLHHKN